MPDILLLPLVAGCAAVVSGVFGMAGGMILFAVLVERLGVAEAMVLHGATQLVSNGTRAWLLRGSIHGPLVRPWLGGVAAAAILAGLAAWEPDRRTVLIVLGTLPLAGLALPARWLPDPRGPRTAAGLGAAITAVQVVAGVSGPLLDLLFVRSGLEREGIVGTKAVTQCAGHAVKVLHWGLVLPAALGGSLALDPALFVALPLAAVAGTHAGRALLRRIDETTFRRGSKVLVAGLSCLLLARAFGSAAAL